MSAKNPEVGDWFIHYGHSLSLVIIEISENDCTIFWGNSYENSWDMNALTKNYISEEYTYIGNLNKSLAKVHESIQNRDT